MLGDIVSDVPVYPLPFLRNVNFLEGAVNYFSPGSRIHLAAGYVRIADAVFPREQMGWDMGEMTLSFRHFSLKFFNESGLVIDGDYIAAVIADMVTEFFQIPAVEQSQRFSIGIKQ